MLTGVLILCKLTLSGTINVHFSEGVCLLGAYAMRVRGKLRSMQCQCTLLRHLIIVSVLDGITAQCIMNKYAATDRDRFIIRI